MMISSRRRMLFATTAPVFAAVVLWSALRAASPHEYGQRSAGAALTGSPVLVELFTSEGCSSCPPADDLLREMVDAGAFEGVPVIALSEHVDYWNRLGWTDPYSSSAFTRRQQQYSERLGASVYTPQMVVDGRIEFVGSERRAAANAVSESARTAKVPIALQLRAGPASRLVVTVALDEPPSQRGEFDVMLAIAEDNLVSDVARGENQGRKLAHTAVVRRLESIGRWRADRGAATFSAKVDLDPAWRRNRIRAVVFLQARDGGPVAGVTSMALPIDGQTN